MPVRPLNPCQFPRCPAYADRSGYCPAHRRDGKKRDEANPWKTPDHTQLFLRLRRAFLRNNPICVACRRSFATDLDHIVAHRGDLGLFWDQANWQGLCSPCHGRKTWKETQGASSYQGRVENIGRNHGKGLTPKFSHGQIVGNPMKIEGL